MTPSVADNNDDGKHSIPPMAPSAHQIYGRALWDPTPTTTELSQRQLAYAMGYPDGWQVERRVEVSKHGKPLVVDTIHAVSKSKSQCIWFNHQAAQKAASEMLAQEETVLLSSASHLLPPMPLYSKGDQVQISVKGNWCGGIIQKRRKNGDDFFYSVQHVKDSHTVHAIPESDLKPGENPYQLATEMGFPEGWQASRKGSRYLFITPSDERLGSKKAAMKYLKDEEEKRLAPSKLQDKDMGDPPWRTEGHDLIGRRVLWTQEIKVTSKRTIPMNQYGTITGYIAANDVDSEGNPGFVSEITGKTSNLFHVDFPDDPTHPYPQHLLASQDLEECEIDRWLLPEEKKKAKATETTKTETPSKTSRKRRR